MAAHERLTFFLSQFSQWRTSTYAAAHAHTLTSHTISLTHRRQKKIGLREQIVCEYMLETYYIRLEILTADLCGTFRCVTVSVVK